MANLLNVCFKPSDEWCWQLCKYHGTADKWTFNKAFNVPKKRELFGKPTETNQWWMSQTVTNLQCQQDWLLLTLSSQENSDIWAWNSKNRAKDWHGDDLNFTLCWWVAKINIVIVGKSHCPRMSEGITHQLPVTYSNSQKRWCTSTLLQGWFSSMPKVRRYQNELIIIS